MIAPGLLTDIPYSGTHMYKYTQAGVCAGFSAAVDMGRGGGALEKKRWGKARGIDRVRRMEKGLGGREKWGRGTEREPELEKRGRGRGGLR